MYMASSGFFKGEKKKAKKDKEVRVTSGAPIFQLPEIITKKKKDR